MSSRLTSIALVSVAVLSIAAAGVAAGIWLAHPPVPPSLDNTNRLTVVPVTSRDFTDRRTVSVEVQPSSNVPLAAGVSGRLTSVTCQVGGVVTSGTSFVSVDGIPLLALATTTPLWRDLKIGTKGADVTAIQAELLRLGQDVPQDGVLGRSTLAGLTAVLQSIGAPAVSGNTIVAGSIVWLPSPAASFNSCDGSIGAFVGSGDQLASAAGPATAVIVDLPLDLVAGERVLSVDGRVVAIDESGVIADASALQSTASYRSAAAETTQPTVVVAGAVELTAATTVSVVPPSSLVGTGAGRCVVAEGVVFPVSIVGSELGLTLVTFDPEAAVPTEVELHPDVDPSSCM